MARQDLLDERRSRTRHSDNEDRRAAGVAEPLIAAHQLGSEYPKDAVEPTDGRCLVIASLRSFHGIAFPVMIEPTLVLANVAQGLTQRKMENCPIDRG